MGPRLQLYGQRDLSRAELKRRLPAEQAELVDAVARVLPFRANRYVVEELIDWNRVPDDPIYQLTFPQPGMLAPDDLRAILDLTRGGAPEAAIEAAARRIQRRLSPHPGSQLERNVPELDGERLEGVQHKYRDTVLVFPSAGQQCHAYCSYCFRWAQFVGIDELRMAIREPARVVRYLTAHPEVSDVLLTGGDPLMMSANALRRWIEPLLRPSLAHIRTVRIGTKALSYWPHRLVTDRDADALLRLFEEVVAAGKHLALMAHYSHPVELSTPVAREALARARGTGAVVRAQAPLIRHVNDAPSVWSELWAEQVRLGAVPYYMFVERDTGARRYFEVPLAEALEIHTQAARGLSGLGRTATGPTMSATPGKIVVRSVARIHGERVFVLQMVRGRDPDWAGRTFFARFDRSAVWLSDLEPALGERSFFFEPRADAPPSRYAAAPD